MAEATYTVKLTGKVGNIEANEQTTSIEYQLTVKNPCVDSNYVNIVGEDLESFSYMLGTGNVDYDPHGNFTLEFPLTASHSLCGEIVHEGRFKPDGDAPLPADGGDPLNYDTENLFFCADSSDTNLLSNP